VALKPSLFTVATRRRLATGHRRFGKAYRSHLRGSTSPRRIPYVFCKWNQLGAQTFL